MDPIVICSIMLTFRLKKGVLGKCVSDRTTCSSPSLHFKPAIVEERVTQLHLKTPFTSLEGEGFMATETHRADKNNPSPRG